MLFITCVGVLIKLTTLTMSHKVKCTIGKKKNTPIDQFIILNFSKYMCQGWGLRKIAKSPKVPNDEILGAQHLSLQEKKSFLVA